jgi:uncharacterized protein (DUF1330 family)
MSAYLIADVEVHDPAGYDEYRRGVLPLVLAHGGKFLVRGGANKVLEGPWSPHRTVVIEFPSMEALDAFYNDPAYAPLIALRQRISSASLIAVQGA